MLYCEHDYFLELVKTFSLCIQDCDLVVTVQCYFHVVAY